MYTVKLILYHVLHFHVCYTVMFQYFCWLLICVNGTEENWLKIWENDGSKSFLYIENSYFIAVEDDKITPLSSEYK